MKKINFESKAKVEVIPEVVVPKQTVFKVVFGYAVSDFLLVDNMDDLCKAMYAKIEKTPVVIGGKFISGQEIKQIVPDVHSYTGWYRSYDPTSGEDFAQIQRDVPKMLDTLISLAAERVGQICASGEVERIGHENLTPQLLLNSK